MFNNSFKKNVEQLDKAVSDNNQNLIQYYEDKVNGLERLISQKIEKATDAVRRVQDRFSKNTLKLIDSMEGNYHFGDFSFVLNIARACTFASLTEVTHLFVLTGADFIQIFKDLFQQMYFVSLCLLKNLSITKFCLETVSYCFKLHKTLSLNQIAYHENENSDFLYIIKKGSVELRKRITSSSTRNEIITVVRQGELFGQEALISYNPLRYCTAQSTYQGTEVIGVNLNILQKILASTMDQTQVRQWCYEVLQQYQQKFYKYQMKHYQQEKDSMTFIQQSKKIVKQKKLKDYKIFENVLSTAKINQEQSSNLYALYMQLNIKPATILPELFQDYQSSYLQAEQFQRVMRDSGIILNQAKLNILNKIEKLSNELNCSKKHQSAASITAQKRQSITDQDPSLKFLQHLHMKTENSEGGKNQSTGSLAELAQHEQQPPHKYANTS